MSEIGESNKSEEGSGSDSILGTGSAKTVEKDEFSHSHTSSLKASACGASATSDSAYGGSNTQSQRSGSGSGSGSSKSQHSSNSSNNAAPESKSRKEKDPKKRKSKGTIPITHSAACSNVTLNSDLPGNTSVTATAAALNTAASTAVANACTSSTVAGSSSAAMCLDSAANSNLPASTKLSTVRKKQHSAGILAVAESRVLQAAALTRALDYLQGSKISKGDGLRLSRSVIDDTSSTSRRSVLVEPVPFDLKKVFYHLEDLHPVKAKEAFIAAISLQDGVVVYVTSSLTDKLGYPSEMWLGRSLLDFLHPKDRFTFTNQITSKLLAGVDKDDSCKSSHQDVSLRTLSGSNINQTNSLCCRLRMYRGLRTSGFGIVDKKTSYIPFKITLTLEKVNLTQEPDDKCSRETLDHSSDNEEGTTKLTADSCEYYLLAYAVPITSAYKNSDEKNPVGHFGLRHSANCLFSEVDLGSVPYLGHLPQDLLGASALDFYHPNDLAALKDIYSSIIRRQGKSIKSKPYYFRAFNGCYVLLETDWTCFVNPWTRKLEFIAGHHRVLKGPSNPDVFANPPESLGSPLDSLDSSTAENVKKIQSEICSMLSAGSAKSPQPHSCSRGDNDIKDAAARRRKDLALLMGTLIDEVSKVKGGNCDCCCSSSCCRSHSPIGGSLLGDASVVMGDISPHHAGSRADSNSVDTPLSYSQLNYNENLERYFQSQPKMMPSDGSGEGSGSGGSKPEVVQTPNISSEEEGGVGASSGVHSSSPRDSQQLSSSKSNSHTHSNSNSGTDSQNGQSPDEFKGPPLTKEMLSRHNEDMEKEFMQHHRELRNRITYGHKTVHGHIKEPHGIKRGQAASWEEGTGGRHKHPHIDDRSPTHNGVPTTTIHPQSQANGWPSLTGPTVIPVNLLPPFSMTTGSANHSSPMFSVPVAHSSGGGSPITTVTVTNSLPGVLPAYYVSTTTGRVSSAAAVPIGAPLFVPQPSSGNVPLGSYSFQQFSYLPGVIYQPIMVPPVLLQPTVMLPTAPSAQSQLSCNSASLRTQLRTHRHYHQTSQKPQELQNCASDELDTNEHIDKQIPMPLRDLETNRIDRELHSTDNAGTMSSYSRTARPHSEATSLKAELGSGAASNVSGPTQHRLIDYSTTSAVPVGPATGSSIPTALQNTPCHAHLVDESPSSGLDENSFTSDASGTAWPQNNTTLPLHRTTTTEINRPSLKKIPPWMECVTSTAEFIYQYQVPNRNLAEILQQDREKLQQLAQPTMLNDQLFQLYREMEEERRNTFLGLDDSETTTSSSGTEEINGAREVRKRSSEFRQTMLYEENAPFPKP